MEQETIIREVASIGNGAHLFVPKEWIGNSVKIILLDKKIEIKKDVLKLLENYLEDIIGIYLTGSYARNEQTKESDIDIIVISKSTKKEIISGKYHISITTLDGVKKTLNSYPELILPRIAEAKVILNPQLLEELKKTKVTKKSFKNFIEDTKRMIKMNKEIIEINKLENRENVSESVIYSSILRLRGIFLIKLILNKKNYKKKDFLLFLKKSIKNSKKIYGIYEKVRDSKKPKEKADINSAEKLQEVLIREIKSLE
jgi:predicted nucleotidyltransferase